MPAIATLPARSAPRGRGGGGRPRARGGGGGGGVAGGHPCGGGVGGGEGGGGRGGRDERPAVGTEGVRHHRGKGGGPASGRVRAGADRDHGNGEVEAADQEDADDHASVEIPLRIPEFLRHVGGVLVPQVGPDNQGGRRADRTQPAREERRVVGRSDSRGGCDDRDDEGDENGGHPGELHAPGGTGAGGVDHERQDEDARGHGGEVEPGKGEDKGEVGRRRDGRRGGAEDGPRQKEPSSRRPGAEADG